MSNSGLASLSQACDLLLLVWSHNSPSRGRSGAFLYPTGRVCPARSRRNSKRRRMKPKSDTGAGQNHCALSKSLLRKRMSVSSTQSLSEMPLT